MEDRAKNGKDYFLKDYRALYLFLIEEWGKDRVGRLRELLVASVNSVEESSQEAAFEDIWGDIRTAIIAINELDLGRSALSAILLRQPFLNGLCSLDEIKLEFGEEALVILRGLIKIAGVSDKKTAVESENYIKLLLSIAEDIRVVFIMVAQHLRMMREAKTLTSAKRLELSVESTYLYAPLAHRLGFYSIKSELEDLSLKYTDRNSYDYIAGKLNETKRSRDKYIGEFIEPLKRRLDTTGFNYDIKGRTKSISSIYNKLKKQKIEFESIYDLFAIRIILDAPLEHEKAQCWQVYSIVTDMYQPNPKRLKDWLSIPKTNGYESLHITVMGNESKWVEVQIRSKRMDAVAERGLAAHWKYKGIKEESGFDDWLQSLRKSLEDKNSNLSEKLTDFKLDLYEEEIFVFTPKGDLYKLPKGATLLDFAFAIHSTLGAGCVSGRVNGKNVSIRYKLKSGDQVEVNSSSHQSPKQDWLNFVVTSKARSKIRQLLKEEAGKQVDIAKEMLARRMKNRKIEINEARLMRLIKKMRYKTVTDFYTDIATGKNDLNQVIDRYLELEDRESDNREPDFKVSADQFKLKRVESDYAIGDELIIDQNLTGIDYRLAKCCNPIFGDEIFGFVSTQGIKIHRVSCPNAQDLFSRYGYRVIKARWSGKTGRSNYTIILKVIGNDQINIVENLMSIISKEEGVQLRSISIDSDDGLFRGNLAVMLSNVSKLESLIKKLKVVKGVKSISRLI